MINQRGVTLVFTALKMKKNGKNDCYSVFFLTLVA